MAERQAAAVTGGGGLAPLTAQEMYRCLSATRALSVSVTGIEPVLLKEPVCKLRMFMGGFHCDNSESYRFDDGISFTSGLR